MFHFQITIITNIAGNAFEVLQQKDSLMNGCKYHTPNGDCHSQLHKAICIKYCSPAEPQRKNFEGDMCIR